MKILILIIIIYILNIFISRYFNKLSYKLDKKEKKLWETWFIPILGPIVWIIIHSNLCEKKYKKENRGNWFTGKNW